MSQLTPAQLTVSTSVAGTDLYTGYPTGGPMYGITAPNLRLYMQANCLLLDGTVAMTGTLLGYVGTESLPGYTFNGDTDTGIYHPSANEFIAVTGGLGRAQFDSSGITILNGGAFVGNLTGNVTGNVTGNLTGNVTGNVTGNLIGNANWYSALSSTQSNDYQFVIGDAGKTVVFDGAAKIISATIPANASVAFGVGTFIRGYNGNSSTMTVAITSDSLRWFSGSATGSGTRTIAIGGYFTLWKYASTQWYITGTGIT